MAQRWFEVVCGVLAVILMLGTSYFFLDMHWVLQPFHMMAAVLANAVMGGR